ncbi:RNA polymerase I-specific transcription initiation factor RRN3 [Rhynchospora pubera]|uniref:RNA polymerase I-specific transcription initiation factor RRN3 n=1 Tax=Rhynchospora pubera TaxID=906938 RepID=A0AAV8CI30_9POAL|nr:RNA polymerase I-specific transcription initiation factor RRN3 [Rhynchospora pubera]
MVKKGIQKATNDFKTLNRRPFSLSLSLWAAPYFLLLLLKFDYLLRGRMGVMAGERMVGHVADEEEEQFSDSEAFAKVHAVLDSVRMAPSLVDPNDREQYDYILSVVDPSARFGPDQEALLTTILKALGQAVSRIDPTYHAVLLSNVFQMSIWFFGNDTRTALLKLINNLAAVTDKFLEGCLHMIVSNFVPPDRVLRWLEEPKWDTRKREIHQQLRTCLQKIFEEVPLAPFKLCDILDLTTLRLSDSKAKMNVYVDCMLGLQSGGTGDILSVTLLKRVINLLVDLDVNITWNDLLQEDQSIGIFDMELEDVDDLSLQFYVDDGKDRSSANNKGSNRNNNSAYVEKLDSLMVVVCEHLNSCVHEKSGQKRLLLDYEMFMRIFRTAVLKLHKSKFTQFVMFYACSLDPETWGLRFAVDLADIFLSTYEDPVSRMSAISYLASYLARAKFISSSEVALILIKLVNWCSDYCKVVQERINPLQEILFNPLAHKIYYSACQAVMYILCFRMRQLMDVPPRSFLFDLPLGYILFNGLDPLKVCLPSIVQEFLRQARAARLFHASVASVNENAIDSELSKAFGGTERLDIFFPFDPYLLKESDRFIRPNFVYWSKVKTTYSNCYSEEDNEEEDEEFEDLDAPGTISSFQDHYNVDCSNSDGEEDDLDYSLNKMSITPKNTFNLHMPAKIRPSMSPV